MDEASKKL